MVEAIKVIERSRGLHLKGCSMLAISLLHHENDDVKMKSLYTA